MNEEMIQKLIKVAIEAREKSYAPYSNFKVGAALLTTEDVIISGCNIESAAYSPTICAERTALAKAISEGHSSFQAICVVGNQKRTFPCGVCRQFLREFSKDMTFIIASTQGDYDIYTMEMLLPHSFGPEDLEGEAR